MAVAFIVGAWLKIGKKYIFYLVCGFDNLPSIRSPQLFESLLENTKKARATLNF